MTIVRTAFAPRQHGLRFENAFSYQVHLLAHLPVGRPFAFGLCGGMCLAALDYWYAGQPVPSYRRPPPPGDPLYRYLLRRQVDSLMGLDVLPRLATWVLKSDRAVESLTAREFERLRPQLDLGLPTVLLLVRSSGLGDPTMNHQVLATGYEFDEQTHRANLMVYDPIYPNEEIVLIMDLADPATGIGLWHQKGDLTRGFYVTRYKPRTEGLPLLGAP